MFSFVLREIKLLKQIRRPDLISISFEETGKNDEDGDLKVLTGRKRKMETSGIPSRMRAISSITSSERAKANSNNWNKLGGQIE